MSRLDDLQRLYALLGYIAAGQNGPRPLPEVIASPVAQRGVYFFIEPGEVRHDSGDGPRVIRVGTHALKAGATSTLRGRLRQHGGSRSGSGNHRGSIFRLLTGDALIRCGTEQGCPSWGVKDIATLGLDRVTVKQAELATEQAVSRRLAAMGAIWLNIDDAPGPASLRGWIERNAIALLSNEGKHPIDAPSPNPYNSPRC